MRTMIYCGISDEAGNSLDSQIAATQALGWKHLEMRNVELLGFQKGNFHDIPDAAFDLAVARLQETGVEVYCFAATIGNWAKSVEDSFDISLDEVARTIPRMQRLKARFVRIMSYKVREEEDQMEFERFRRLNEITRRFLDAGIQPVHENCMNYGGMSWQHAHRLLEAVPGLKWVFDTANPVFNADRSRPKPWPRQDPWEFWTHVRDHTAHIHIKDALWNPVKNDADYTWPGEGDGAVERILTDAISRGYTAGISIEPHMVAVYHDAASGAQDEALRANYVEYGKKLMTLVAKINRGLGNGA